MKTFTLTQVGILTLALSFSAVALAERGSTDRQQYMQRFSQMLDLSEEQRDALQALKEESSLAREARQAQMQERLSAILTEEQQAQLQQHREERIAQREGKRDRMGQHANRKEMRDMKGSNRAERKEMRQERRQSRDS